MLVSLLAGAAVLLVAAETQAEVCEPTEVQEVALDIRVEATEERYDLSRGSDDLAAMRGEAGTGQTVRGLTSDRLHSSYSADFSLSHHPDGRVCLSPASISGAIGYSDLVVYIARGYEPGSCQFEAVLEHELEHVAINKLALEEGADAIRKSLHDVLSSGFPLQGSDPDALIAQASALLEQAWQSGLSSARERRDRKHAEIDSPQSYRDWASRCERW